MTLRNQLLFLLALMFGSVLVAKTLVDTARIGPEVSERARAEGRLALLQAAPGIERAFRDGRMADVRAALARLATVGGPGHAAIVDGNGGVLAASDAQLEHAPAAAAHLAWAADVAAMTNPEPATEVRDEALRAVVPIRLRSVSSPDPSLVGPTPAVGGPELGALAFQTDLGLRYAAARRQVIFETAVIAALALLMLWLLAIALRSELERPARRILSAIEAFDGGDRSARTGLKGRSEVMRIGKAFDALAERLRQSEQDLLDVQTRLDRTLQALPVGVMVVRRDDGRPFFVNPRWRELFGIPDDASRDVLSLLSQVRCEHEDGRPYALEELPIPAVLRTGEPHEARDLWVRRDDQAIALAVVAFPLGLSSAPGFDAVLALAAAADATSPVAVPTFGAGEPALASSSLDLASVVAIMESVAAPAVREAAPPPRPAVPEAERETVLLATAQPGELEAAAQALESLGLRVLAAGSGDEAMVYFGREGPRIRLVVLDLALAGPSGEMLLDEILALDPAARIVAVSGYRPDLPVLAASGKIAAFLTRPFRVERLRDTVRQMLGAALGVPTA
jgi:CheY-like chemotaxis protein/PAS domain-containing protein